MPNPKGHTQTLAMNSQSPVSAREEDLQKNPFIFSYFVWFVPAILILFLVTLYPTIFVLWLSFQKTRYYDLVGLQ
ncbi:MAG: hypothetical protein EB015_08625, partial [Methylocystaceae bacterium]|nr:hypothetical protein [Methylocystaceae bacterium]